MVHGPRRDAQQVCHRYVQRRTKKKLKLTIPSMHSGEPLYGYAYSNTTGLNEPYDGMPPGDYGEAGEVR